MKMKILTVYVVMGMVWCAVGLPNLLSTSNNSPAKATALALFRIMTWPVLITKVVYKFIQDNKESNDADNTEND